jgi:hypothetical protein
MAASARHRSSRTTDGRELAAMGWAALLVVVVVLSNWAHHSLSITDPSSHSAAVQPARSMSPPLAPPTVGTQLQAWFTEAKPSIIALFGAADNLVTAARYGNVDAAGSACHTLASAVGNVQHHVPSPDPTLNTKLRQAITDYREGLSHCVPGAQIRDPVELGEARVSTSRGSAELQAAVGIIEDDLSSDARDSRVWTV